MTSSPALDMLARECAIHDGTPPQSLPNALTHSPAFAISRDAFLLTLPSGLRFHYQQGRGVTVAQPDGVTDDEVRLFFNGSVYGAIAWINGLIPLHASGVVQDGAVHAFTGASGAGKSTLVAALSQSGFPLFADDVLVLDLSDPDRVLALPGHKQIKLWGDALTLTGLERGAQVRPEMDKYFVTPSTIETQILPFASLTFLETNRSGQPEMTNLAGIQRFNRVRTALYRPRYCDAVSERQPLFGALSRIAALPIRTFSRPFLKPHFEDGVAFVAATLRGDAVAQAA